MNTESVVTLVHCALDLLDAIVDHLRSNESAVDKAQAMLVLARMAKAQADLAATLPALAKTAEDGMRESRRPLPGPEDDK